MCLSSDDLVRYLYRSQRMMPSRTQLQQISRRVCFHFSPMFRKRRTRIAVVAAAVVAVVAVEVVLYDGFQRSQERQHRSNLDCQTAVLVHPWKRRKKKVIPYRYAHEWVRNQKRCSHFLSAHYESMTNIVIRPRLLLSPLFSWRSKTSTSCQLSTSQAILKYQPDVILLYQQSKSSVENSLSDLSVPHRDNDCPLHLFRSHSFEGTKTTDEKTFSTYITNR